MQKSSYDVFSREEESEYMFKRVGDGKLIFWLSMENKTKI